MHLNNDGCPCADDCRAWGIYCIGKYSNCHVYQAWLKNKKEEYAEMGIPDWKPGMFIPRELIKE